MKIINLGWPERSLTTSTTSYLSDAGLVVYHYNARGR